MIDIINNKNLFQFQRDRWFFQPSYDFMKLYVNYQDPVNHRMDLLMFSFTSSFSITQLYHPYTHVENGPGKMDALLYLFRFASLDSYFNRGLEEESAKDIMIDIWTTYVKGGQIRHINYPACSPDDFRTSGFCRYMVVLRQENQAFVTSGNNYDLQSLDILSGL